MATFDAILLLIQIGVPVALIAWVAMARRSTWTAWALDITIAAAYLVAVALAGVWLAVPRSTVWVLAGLLALAAALGARRIERRESGGGGVALIVRCAAALGLVAVVAYALEGRRSFEGPSVDLAFPLTDGEYVVVSGGSNSLVNFHFETLERERARPFRGQSYAVDVVKAGQWGSRSSLPVGGSSAAGDLSRFAIFEDPIHAPCSGTVVHAEDGHGDLPAPDQPPPPLAGNHVILECGDAWIVLAHMREGSVQVAPGEEVDTGQLLGRVGNSGSSGEPHLHIHAQRPGSTGALLGGDPLPVTFEGRHLVRNDRIRGSRVSASPPRGSSTRSLLRMVEHER